MQKVQVPWVYNSKLISHLTYWGGRVGPPWFSPPLVRHAGAGTGPEEPQVRSTVHSRISNGMKSLPFEASRQAAARAGQRKRSPWCRLSGVPMTSVPEVIFGCRIYSDLSVGHVHADFVHKFRSLKILRYSMFYLEPIGTLHILPLSGRSLTAFPRCLCFPSAFSGDQALSASCLQLHAPGRGEKFEKNRMVKVKTKEEKGLMFRR